MTPKTPPAYRWERLPDFEADGCRMMVFRRGRLRVTSSLIMAEFRGEDRLQWLIAVSAGGKRATDDEVAAVLRDFDMQLAEEDNHFSGTTRSFFRRCDERPGEPSQCECKETETPVMEPDGYRYQHGETTEDYEARISALRVTVGLSPRPVSSAKR